MREQDLKGQGEGKAEKAGGSTFQGRQEFTGIKAWATLHGRGAVGSDIRPLRRGGARRVFSTRWRSFILPAED